MVLNELGFVNQRRLYPMPKFFCDKPTERLADEGIEPEHLNRDVLSLALDARSFACVADAEQVLVAFQNKLTLTAVAKYRIEAVSHHHGRRRRAQDRRPDAVTYQIERALASLPAEYTARLHQHDSFILATNQFDTETLSEAHLLQAYKDQQQVERGFCFFKEPLLPQVPQAHHGLDASWSKHRIHL